MIYLSGIGNSKRIIKDVIFHNGESTSLMEYDVKEFQSISSSDLLVLSYDGFFINEYLKIVPQISKVRYVPVFITPTNALSFGMNDIYKNEKDNYACPYCVTKRSINDHFTLKLYNSLFQQTSYKSIEPSFGLEMTHFTEILMELIKGDMLASHFFKYSLLDNTYSIEKKEGLSRCEICDHTIYNNDVLQEALRGVL